MPVNILFAARPELWDTYQPHLARNLTAAGLRYDLHTDADRRDVDFIVYAPNGPMVDFSGYTRLKAVLSLWAGVESIVTNPTLNVPLTRMVDGGLKQGMTEWVTGHVMRHHLGMDAQITGQNGHWNPVVPPLAHDRQITILGLGALGRACAQTLACLGFDVTGWSRTQKTVASIRCESGQENLRTALSRAEIAVLLLPDTPATHDILNAQTLELMPRGAVIINPGRGTLINDAALIAALDSGQIGHATLDVFRTEPLPPEHPFWAHPNVTVTPHIASETRPASASEVIAENIRRGVAGEPFLHLVNRDLGY